MIQKAISFVFLLIGITGYSQYQFEGQIANNASKKTVYLSLIEDYRKLSRPYLDHVIKKTDSDSLGYFSFKGNNLPSDNRIYRIHVDECSVETLNSNHFLGRCENSSSILFIANNSDFISFPTSFADEALCKIASTNPLSDAMLQIDAFKEEMAFDFYDIPSEASRKLNTKKWFKTLQEFGLKVDEPLVELYIYDFLSDKRNETYAYYLNDISKNDYYEDLGQRLEDNYPNTVFTELFQTEIAIDQQLISKDSSSDLNWKWISSLVIGLSMLLNVYFLLKQRKQNRTKKSNSLAKLTVQEQNIVNEILKDKTNKEIASDLFISLSTVKTHINNLYKKLHVSSREEIKELFG